MCVVLVVVLWCLGLHCVVLVCGYALAVMVCVCTGVVFGCSKLSLLLLPRALLIADYDTLGDCVHAHGPPFTMTTNTDRKSSPGTPPTPPPCCPVIGDLAFLHLNVHCAGGGALVSGGGLGLPCVLLASGNALAAMVFVCTGVVLACSLLVVLLLPLAMLIVRRLVTVFMPTARLSQRRQTQRVSYYPVHPTPPLCPVLWICLLFEHLDMCCAGGGASVSGGGLVLPCVLLPCGYALAAKVFVCAGVVWLAVVCWHCCCCRVRC